MIATDKSQSQRLIACGVSANTADMAYCTIDSLLLNAPYVEMRDRFKESNCLPAWSLSALLDILPKELNDFPFTKWYDPFQDGWDISDKESECTINGSLQLYHNGEKYVVNYDWDGFLGQMPCADDPIEACVLAIELLAANGYDFGKNNQEEADDGNDE